MQTGDFGARRLELHQDGFLKLLMVTHYFESHRSGIELIAGRLIRELAHLGQEMVWAAINVTPPPALGEFGCKSVPLRGINITERWLGIPFPIPTPGSFLQIRREVRCADAVLLQDSLYPACVAAFVFARSFRKPVVIAQHVGIVPYNNPVFRLIMQLANRIVVRPMLARADRIAFFSEITANYFTGINFRSSPELIFTGVDTDVYFPISANRKLESRRDLGFEPDRPVVLFVGRFVEKKGLHILSLMARIRSDIIWALAGWGPLNPADWALPNVIVFSDLAGASLAALYRASDLLVLPSKGEGFPLVIQEALACGLPVVCSADTARADAAASQFLSTVELDEKHPDATALAFCEEIARALEGRGNARAPSQERFRFVSERYCWRATAARYFDVICSALAKD
jgi:glycosyltransferase involved in cell wall biosynthesis